MKKFNKIVTVISLISGLLFSFSASAELAGRSGFTWQGPFTVKSVARLYNGSFHIITIVINESFTNDCPNHANEAYSDSSGYDWPNAMLSSSLTAQAANKKIMLLVSGPCNASYGRLFGGIEVLTN